MQEIIYKNWDIELKVNLNSPYCDRCGGIGKLGLLTNIPTTNDEVQCPRCNGTGLKTDEQANDCRLSYVKTRGGINMKIYEIEIAEKNPSSLSASLYDAFVVIADDFPEAYKKTVRYVERQDIEIIIHSIHEKYVIKQGL